MKIRLLIFSYVLVMLPMTAAAQDAIIFQMKDGNRHVFSLKSQQGSPSPNITFGENEVIIKTSETLHLKLSDLQRYYFDDYATSISPLGGVTPGISFDGEVVTVTNQPDGAKVDVYNVGGLLVRSLTARDGHMTQIPLDGLSSGIYIIKVGSVTRKIMKP